MCDSSRGGAASLAEPLPETSWASEDPSAVGCGSKGRQCVFGRHDTGTSQGEAQKGQKAKRQETHPPADPALTTHSTWPFLQSCVSCLGKSHYVTVRLMTPRVEPVPGAVT